jgi:Exocyst complex component Sec5
LAAACATLRPLPCAPLQGGAAMLAKMQTTSKEFNPWLYLGTAHAGTPREALVEGVGHLEKALAKRKGQLRQLVKENFQRFIGCKGTIDDISLRLEVATSSSTCLCSGVVTVQHVHAMHRLLALLAECPLKYLLGAMTPRAAGERGAGEHVWQHQDRCYSCRGRRVRGEGGVRPDPAAAGGGQRGTAEVAAPAAL